MSKEEVKKFVDSLDKGDNDSAQNAIKNALADKVSSALDDRKVDVAKTIIQPTPEAEAPSDDQNAQ